MARELRFDRALLAVVLAMVVLGLAVLYSSSGVIALARKGNPDYFFVRQSIFVAIGLLALLAALKLPLDLLRQKRVVWGLVAVQLVALAATLAMPAVNGSHRWLRLAGLRIGQPSELAKLTLVLLAAYLLDKREREGKSWGQLAVPLGASAGVAALLILLQPDLGTVVVLAAVLGTMLFAAGLPLRWVGAALLLGALALGVLMVSSAYRRERVLSFLDPERDPQGSGFQARQSLIAVGSGGVTGKWFAGGSQKLMFLPEPHTDFLYAMIGEELGMAGTFGVLGLFLAFGALGVRAARGAPDHFKAYLAVGVTAWIVLQGLVHILVCLTLLPNKGLPLPLMSYGPSAMASGLAGAGLLLNVSQYRP